MKERDGWVGGWRFYKKGKDPERLKTIARTSSFLLPLLLLLLPGLPCLGCCCVRSLPTPGWRGCWAGPGVGG